MNILPLLYEYNASITVGPVSWIYCFGCSSIMYLSQWDQCDTHTTLLRLYRPRWTMKLDPVLRTPYLLRVIGTQPTWRSNMGPNHIDHPHRHGAVSQSQVLKERRGNHSSVTSCLSRDCSTWLEELTIYSQYKQNTGVVVVGYRYIVTCICRTHAYRFML